MQQHSFHVTTIEVEGVTPLQFFMAGEAYKGTRYFWRDHDTTNTIAGVGHALRLTASTTARFTDIEQQWQQATQHHTATAQPPLLFGGVTFDPSNDKVSEWGDFPQALFVVAKFQLVQKSGKTYASAHCVGDVTAEHMQALRKELQALIKTAKTMHVTAEKPKMLTYSEPQKEAYLQSIANVTARIQQGEADKVVIARTLALEFEQELQPVQLLKDLLTEQPTSYVFGFEAEDLFFTGATPERLVMVKSHHAYSSCVAGSIKRGSTSEEDVRLGESLLQDEKNGGEHQYVVDMIAENFAKSCETYTVPEGPSLLKSRDIQHLYTPIEGALKEGTTILQLAKDLHPTPALGGVPREKALEIIREYEPMNREMYASPIGWLDIAGDGEFAVALRCAMTKGNKAYLYAGGGIVADSEPQAEYEETLVKFRPMLRALGGEIYE